MVTFGEVGFLGGSKVGPKVFCEGSEGLTPERQGGGGGGGGGKLKLPGRRTIGGGEKSHTPSDPKGSADLQYRDHF